MNLLTKTLLFSIALLFTSCNGCKQIPANQFVLNSDDYGKTWRQLGPNETVPACRAMGCYNIYLPGSTMTGDLRSKQRIGAPGKGAIAKFLITYQWEIYDPLLFIKEAKELRKSGDYTSDSSLEVIESRLIDKHFHDLMGPLLTQETNVKDFDAGVFEKKFNPILNEDLAKFGIKAFGLSFVVEFGPQLETAIDVAQALEFYEAIGELPLGREVIQRQAGATKVSVTVEDKDVEQ